MSVEFKVKSGGIIGLFLGQFSDELMPQKEQY